MADKATKGKGTRSKNKKANAANGAGMGHNLTEIRKAAEPIFKRLFDLQDEMESTMGEFQSDFKNIYEEGANKIGCSRSLLRREFRRAVRIKKEQQADREMEASERDATEALRASLEGTPFGDFFAGKLAETAQAAASG